MLEAYLFGSVARGDAAPHSDLDIAVYVTQAGISKPGYGIAAELSAELHNALGPSDVDLVLLNQAPPLLYHRVLRDGIRVMSRDLAATTSREGLALSRYCDYLPQFQIIDSAHRQRMAAGGFGR